MDMVPLDYKVGYETMDNKLVDTVSRNWWRALRTAITCFAAGFIVATAIYFGCSLFTKCSARTATEGFSIVGEREAKGERDYRSAVEAAEQRASARTKAIDEASSHRRSDDDSLFNIARFHIDNLNQQGVNDDN